MKKTVLFIISFFLLTPLFSQEWVRDYRSNGSVIRSGQLNRNHKKTGVWEFYHGNGQLWLIGKFDGGKRVGLWKSYDEEGRLAYIGRYVNGKETGLWKMYYEGKLSSIGKYRNGKRVGEWKVYENGRQVDTWQY